MRAVTAGAARWGREGVASLLDLLFPRVCGVCGAFGSFLCSPCTALLSVADGARCAVCARPLLATSHVTADLRCVDCRANLHQPLDTLIAAYRFEGAARRLVLRLKYERLSALAGPMGELLAARLAERPPAIDLIVPTPLHPRRQRDRGFNQAALLAAPVARALGVAIDHRALLRTRHTQAQARTSDAAERARNLAGAFACRGEVAGRSVLLVDDVTTTGATLHACAAPLRQAGARAVHALVFARTE